MKKIFEFSGFDQTPLYSVLWIPDCPAKLILQISHGMTEHIERYDQFARELNSHGILVAGYDLRGHGHNPVNPSCCSLGEGNWKKSLEDMRLFHRFLDSRFPNLPHVLLGFSLGSFLVREYLEKDSSVSGAVLMGTGDQPGWVLTFLKSLVQGQIRKHGFDQTTPLVKKLSFETYNLKFSPAETPCDWMSSDKTEVRRYRNDPLCQTDISSGLFWQLLTSMHHTGKLSSFESWNKQLPVLLLSGDKDPVGDLGKGIQRILKKMNKSGISSVKMHLIPGCRHDLLHEFENGGTKKAIHILISFLLDLT